MNEQSEKGPLLFKLDGVEKTPFFISSAKWIIRASIYTICITWAAFLFQFPLPFKNVLFKSWLNTGERSVFGLTGSIFVAFGGPILAITFLAIAYLIISDGDDIHGEKKKKKKSKNPRISLWTFPVLVDGPFGVVSAAELIGIILFSLYIIWAVTVYTLRNVALLPGLDMTSWEKSAYMLERTSRRLGYIGLMCLAFLFLPISRGSILLRYVRIPFEQATRYHVWLGHLTMFLFALHGLLYGIAWTMEGRLIQELISWKNDDVANLAGVISLVAGMVMWGTSLPGVRRINFELFFYTHQLYVVFVVFLALHVGDFMFCEAAAGIFLFMLDRFLRFCQSRKTVDIVSAKSFPCGALEIVLSKPPTLHCTALSWVFLQVRELSLLQWHPFSVSSYPMDGQNHISILVKVLGGWTGKLKDQILKISENEAQSKPRTDISVSIEGPYGPQSPYHLAYENLILVAGSIGISPFFAILSDILHQTKEGKPCFPRNILIVWAVKTTDELPLLETLDMYSICPNFSEALNLEIQAYVTRQSEPPLEEGNVVEPPRIAVFRHSTPRRSISGLVGTGNIVWSGMYIVASTIGLVVLVSLMDIFYITEHNITYRWYKGLLLLACMIAGVLVFGGFTIGLWHLWERRTLDKEEPKRAGNTGFTDIEPVMHDKKSGLRHYVNSVQYGQRPDFGEIFCGVSERWGNVDIGVIVCGPSTLETSVARKCRAYNLQGSHISHPVFHFHTHSFDL